jgi:hypothetical protein
MKSVKLLEIIKDFQELKKEVLDVFYKNIREENSTQIMCQTNQPGVEDWYTGVGRVESLENKHEDDYFHIQPSLKGSLIEKYILKYNGFRTRIMSMPPKSVYTVHADNTPRIHIPIVTNEHCWMVWPFEQECHHLNESFSYLTDTKKIHTAFNGSLTSHRIHIVMCVDNPPT